MDDRVVDPVPSVEEQEDREEAEDPMAWIGLGLKVGVSQIGSASFTNPTFRQDLADDARMVPRGQLERAGLTGGGLCTVIDRRCATEGRTELHLALPVNLGGDGFGWLIEPYLNLGSNATGYGGYMGPTFNIHILDPLYVGFGFGISGAWVLAEGWDYAADLYGRVPVQVTWYARNALALVAELGVAYGASGYVSKPTEVTLPGVEPFTTAPKLTFGKGAALDATLGFRFP